MPSGVYPRKKPVWNKGLTKETDSRIQKYIDHGKETVRSKYGVDNVFQIKEVQDKIKKDRELGLIDKKVKETKRQRYNDPNYNNMEKNFQTKLDRYGDSHYNNQEKFRETSRNKYGVDHPNQSKEIRNKISQSRISNCSQEKAQQTIIAKYGDLEKYYNMISFKRYETMRKNGTLSNVETKPEKEYYQSLLKKYNEKDIVKQYYDKDRYSFKCDFYIIPEDKFIEINGFFTHGPHPFDKNNPEDLKLLSELEDEGTDWARAVIYTWTDLDVRKLEFATKNNLNYEVIYWYNK